MLGGITRESCPKLLNLMPSIGSDEARGQEEKKLELRLGPPGEPNTTTNNNNNLGDGNNKGLVGLLSERSRIPPPKTRFSFDITTLEKPHNNTSSQKRSAPGPVVGWPPIRSFRKNNCPKPSNSPPHDSKKLGCDEETNNGEIKGGESMFVKINMEGVGIGRKVDLMAYDNYDKLSSAVDVLFRGLLEAQRDNGGEVVELKPINGGEYTLVYEDNEGDRMLLGDVPWLMFLSTVKRLRVLKTSQLSSLGIGGDKHDKIHPK